MCSPGCSGLKPPGAHVAVAQGEDALAKLPPLAGVPVRLNHPGKYPHSATRFLPPRAAVNGVGEEAGAGGEGLARCGSPRCTRPRSRRLCRCPWRSGTGAPSRSPRLSESRLLAMLSTQGLWRVRAAYLRYGAAGKGVAVVLPPYLRRRVAPEFVLRAAKAVVRQQQQAPRRLVVHVPAPLEVHRPGEYLPSVLLFHAVFVDGLPHAPRPPPTGPARPRGTARPPSQGIPDQHVVIADVGVAAHVVRRLEEALIERGVRRALCAQRPQYALHPPAHAVLAEYVAVARPLHIAPRAITGAQSSSSSKPGSSSGAVYVAAVQPTFLICRVNT